jgi:hypothetical protein
MVLRLLEINFRIYKIYPTVTDNWAYGIPKEWPVNRLGWANATMAEFEVEDLLQLGREKLVRTALEHESLLLPLTIKSTLEEVELVEGLSVTQVQLSALAAVPEDLKGII